MTTYELSEKIDSALRLVRAELFRAYSNHAPMNSPHEGWAIIKEEVDELWKDVKGNHGESEAARIEAMQVAAMGVRYMIDVASK